ncbi:MAG TPA: tetratricopeptide repeat protein [Thermomicrobiales bacterium]|nr:tetratricopeptide repeat protein [Thermomicrobiales bacterium]
MPRSRPVRRPPDRKRSAPRKPVSEQFGTSRAMKIGFIALAMLFTCSLLAGSLVLIPFDELFGSSDDAAQNIVDRNDDIIEELRATYEANPDDVGNVILLANVLGNSGRLDEAIPYYEEAIDLAPDDPSVRLDFARSLADGGYHADAELQFERVLEMEPNSQEALYYLAELYMDWEPPREEEARELYQRAIEADPDSFLAEQARNQLDSMFGTPTSPASPQATPAGDGTVGRYEQAF